MTAPRDGDPDISVIVPTYNRSHLLSGLIERLARQTLSPSRFEVIVVDDCSTDDTSALLSTATEAPISIKVMRTSANTGGPAAPRNLGWRAARASIVAFTDDDCRPDPDWLESGLQSFEAHPSWGVMQGATLPPAGTDLHQLNRWSVWRAITGPTPWFEAANIFYRRDALLSTSGFNEAFTTWGEDTDLGWAVVSAGWDRGFASGAVVYHDVDTRGWRYAARFAWRDRHLIEIASRHPEFREEAFWRPWAIHRRSAEFALAITGAALGLRWRPALALALPYLSMYRPAVRDRGFARECLAIAAVDATRFVGDVVGSVSSRILVI